MISRGFRRLKMVKDLYSIIEKEKNRLQQRTIKAINYVFNNSSVSAIQYYINYLNNINDAVLENKLQSLLEKKLEESSSSITRTEKKKRRKTLLDFETAKKLFKKGWSNDKIKRYYRVDNWRILNAYRADYKRYG